MLKIRLQRVGRRNDASFRVVLTEHTRGPKTGNHIDLLGSYDPRSNKAQLHADRIKSWISKGAQVSDTLHNLLVREGVIEGKKINVLPKKTVPKKEEEAVPEAATAAAAETPAEAPAEAPTEEAPAEATPEEPKEA